MNKSNHLITLCYIPYADGFEWIEVAEIDKNYFLETSKGAGLRSITQQNLIDYLVNNTFNYILCCSLEQSPKQQRFCNPWVYYYG